MLREVRFSKLHIHMLFMTRVTDTTGPKISIQVMKTCRESGRSDKTSERIAKEKEHPKVPAIKVI